MPIYQTDCYIDGNLDQTFEGYASSPKMFITRVFLEMFRRTGEPYGISFTKPQECEPWPTETQSSPQPTA